MFTKLTHPPTVTHRQNREKRHTSQRIIIQRTFEGIGLGFGFGLRYKLWTRNDSKTAHFFTFAFDSSVPDCHSPHLLFFPFFFVFLRKITSLVRHKKSPQISKSVPGGTFIFLWTSKQCVCLFIDFFFSNLSHSFIGCFEILNVSQTVRWKNKEKKSMKEIKRTE